TYGGENTETEFNGSITEKDVKRVRIIERQYYRMRKLMQLVDLTTGDVRDVTEKMAADREKLQMLIDSDPNITMREIDKKAVRTTITAGYTVLFDNWSLYDT
ncbi:hypothetical protein Q5708_15905, partial [Lactiplantibacillus plantarum]|uniref:hypothetical protein n=1 Tax=Lactiplantibacillus plantarum TaxID=1590 RepID=UPI00271F7C73